ncbi:MAG: hypothetical protein K2K70_06385 [Lachnospiraceae bacterium]|nr:hypothetical protein [Lachnospiraceae bacterium]
MTIYCIFFDGGRIFGLGYFVPGAALYQRRKMGVQGGERQNIVCVERKKKRYYRKNTPYLLRTQMTCRTLIS